MVTRFFKSRFPLKRTSKQSSNHHLIHLSPMLRCEGEGLHYLVEGESVGDDTFN
jgi:hypothetical protein